MITKNIETKFASYLAGSNEVSAPNKPIIVEGVSDGKRELPCIVAYCDSVSDYPNMPIASGIFVMNLKVMVMQSNTEPLPTFIARSDEIHNALRLFETMRNTMNTNTSNSLFVYGFRNLKVENAVEEQHFVITYSLEAVAS